MYKLFSFFFLSLIFLFVISCEDNSSNTTTDPQDYINADGINGGILYDKFWSVEGGYDQNSPNKDHFDKYSDFFRCKQCHGWDLMGNSASYNSRGPKTNRPNVAAVNLWTKARNMGPQELFDLLKNGAGKTRRPLSTDLSTYDPAKDPTIGDQMPALKEFLTDKQIWDLVKFIKVEALDVTQLYDATYTGTYPTGKATYTNIGKDGDAAKGLEFYNANCKVCHGADGKAFLMENMSTGKFTRTKPYEVQHKVKFGQLGSTMKKTPITMQQMKDLYKALADTTKFPD